MKTTNIETEIPENLNIDLDKLSDFESKLINQRSISVDEILYLDKLLKQQTNTSGYILRQFKANNFNSFEEFVSMFNNPKFQNQINVSANKGVLLGVIDFLKIISKNE